MVSDDFLPNPGGIAAHVFELSRALGGLGHQVDLIVGHDKKNQGELPALGDGVRLLRQRAFGWNTLGYASTMLAKIAAIAPA